jgi:hypothetical protein
LFKIRYYGYTGEGGGVSDTTIKPSNTIYDRHRKIEKIYGLLGM